MTDYYFSTDNSLLDKKKIFYLLRDCFWSKNIPFEYIERFIKYSLCFGVYYKRDHSMQGFGRVISDYTTYAYICDLIIHPAHRRKGLASQLMKEIMAHPELQGLKTWSLITTDEAKNIYEKLGFTSIGNRQDHLEINRLDIYTEKKFVNVLSVD